MLGLNSMDGSAPFPGSPAPSSMVDAPTLLPVSDAQPVFASEQYRAARRGAGIGLLLATAGTGVGLWIGGPVGAGAGLLLVGAARNAVRATRDWRDADLLVRQEAGTNAALALFGTLLGGYLGYRVYSKRTGEGL
jgi:hypothetical protein